MLVIRVGVGEQTDTVLPERRADGELLVRTLRESGLAVTDLEDIEDAGRPGVAPAEWVTILLGAEAGSAQLTNLTNDVYDAAQLWAIRRQRRATAVREPGRSKPVGFVIFGPDGQEFRRWSTLDEAPLSDEHWVAPTGTSPWRKAIRKLPRRD